MSNEKKVDRREFLKTTGALGLGLAAGSLPGLAHAQKAAVKEDILVGVLAPLTGGNASVGQHAKNSIEMGFEEINEAGGIKSLGGRKIKVLFGNDEGKPESGMAEAERLIRGGAVMLLGPEASHVAYATTAVAEKYKICQVLPISTADNITERGFKYTFRTCDRTALQGPVIMNFIKWLETYSKTDLKTGVIMHVDNLYGRFQADTVKKAAKATGIIQILDDIAYPENPRDLTAEIIKAKSYKPDLLMPASFIAECILITNTMHEQRFEPKGVLGLGAHFHLPEFVQAVGKRANYILNITSFQNNLSKKTQAYAKKYMARYNKLITYHGANFYETAFLAADVLERAGSTDSAKIREALSKTNFPSDIVTREGNITFDETGQCTKNLRALLQILDERVNVIYPQQFSERMPVFPIPKS
jgi:branched-chain amino acid transport system substrate-binding protein